MRNGFTLIELLISMSIAGLMIALTALSYNQYINYWNKSLGSFDDDIKHARLVYQLSDAISNTAPYLVQSNKGIGGYFLGRDEGFTAVTSAPIFSNNTQFAVIRIFSEKKEGTQVLVYEEAPIGQGQLKQATQTLDFRYRLEVVHADEIAFRYKGWPSMAEKYSDDVSNQASEPEWLAELDSLESQTVPVAIAIAFNQQELVWQLPRGSDKRIKGMESYDI